MTLEWTKDQRTPHKTAHVEQNLKNIATQLYQLALDDYPVRIPDTEKARLIHMGKEIWKEQLDEDQKLTLVGDIFKYDPCHEPADWLMKRMRQKVCLFYFNYENTHTHCVVLEGPTIHRPNTA